MTAAQNLFLDMAGNAPNVVGIPGGIESEVPLTIQLEVGGEIEAGSSIFSLEDLMQTGPSSDTCVHQPQSQVFPPPGSKRTRNPRSDKLESDLRIEVLRLEKAKLEAVLELINLKHKHALEKHAAKMRWLQMKQGEF